MIGSIDELKPNADQGYVLIRRVVTPGRHIAVLSADLAAALRDPASPANVALQPRDTLTVFDLQTGRDRIIEPLMQELSAAGQSCSTHRGRARRRQGEGARRLPARGRHARRRPDSRRR